MPHVDPEARRAIGTLGAHTSWANTTDRSARTAPGRAALEAKFLAAADGDPVRAEHLKKAHYIRMSLKSAESRRAKQLTREQREALAAILLGETP